MRWKWRATLVLAMLGTLGCRSASTTRHSAATVPVPAIENSSLIPGAAPARIGQPPVPSPGSIVLASGTAEPSEPEYGSSAPQEPGVNTVSLVAAIEQSLAQHPDLIAARQADAVAVAALGLAQTYPFNPFLQSTVTPWQDAQNGGPGTTYHYVLLMQNLQLAHQQQYREEGGAAVLNSVRWNIRQAELLNVSQTTRLYFTALYQRGLRDIARDNHDINRQLLEIVEKQLAAGQTTAADAAIVRVDVAATLKQAQVADAMYESALRDLRRQLNVSPLSTLEPAGDLLALRWRDVTAETIVGAGQLGAEYASPGLEPAVALAAARPDVLALRADIDTARAGLRLATASKTPDLQIGPYYQRTDDGTTFLGLRAHFDIPVVNSGAPLESQRNAELHQRITAWNQLQIRAELEATAAIDRYRFALRLVRQLDGQPADAIPPELVRLEEQFRAGEIDIVRMMQARISVIQNRRAQLDQHNELAQSAAALVAAAAVMPERLLE